MATCKNCGRQVSSWNLNGLGLCVQCTQEETLKEREDLVNLLGSGLIRCQFALTDFISTAGVSWVSIGDLFAGENSLAFIELAGDTKQNFLHTQGRAMEVRKEDFGLTLEDRIRKHGGTVIPKQNIISISRSGKTGLAIEYKGGLLNLGNDNAPEYHKKLIEWQQGTGKDEVDAQGVNLNLGFPSIDRLVSWLVNGQILSEIDQDKLAEILSRTSYIQNILRTFEKLKFQQKAACLATVFTLSKDWIDVFRKYLVERKRSTLLKVFGFGLGCCLLIGGGIYIFISDIFPPGMWLFVFLCLIGVGAGFIIDLSSVGELNRLLALFAPDQKTKRSA